MRIDLQKRIEQSHSMLNIESILSEVKRNGYFFSRSHFNDESCDLSDDLSTLSNLLGTPNKGRNGKIVETLTPKNRDEAHRNSLSNQYGKNEFPFHVDMAHHQVPSRYLRFACSAANGNVAPTLLLSVHDLKFTCNERTALETGVFLVKNGSRSFYTNIKGPDAAFLRWDPGCMHPKDRNAELVAEALSHQANISPITTINWSTGALLVVDNWTMLHARGQVQTDHGERFLLRTTVQ